MKFVIGGRSFNLNDLEPSLDQTFVDLYASYIGNTPFVWSTLFQAVQTFLQKSPDRNNVHNLYFNNFTRLWGSFLSSGNFDEAENIWRMALDPVLEFEANNAGREVHKGTAYYFWGMTSILRGDLDRGYSLVHQAVEEDIATMKQAYPPTPAFALASLNYSKHDQAFRDWVIRQAQFLNEFQNAYSSTYNRKFILEDFRSSFLNSPPSTDIVFLFAYTVARFMSIHSTPVHSLRSKFTGQLLVNLFFDLTLTIDAAAKAKNPAGKTFIHQAKFISQKAGDALSITKLKKINKQYNIDFEKTLSSIINGTFTFSDGTGLSKLQADIAVAYGIRNKGAHDISGSPTIWKRFTEIEQIILNVLFMTIDYCY